MARKRVHALYPRLRAPDGSAFTKCELCGVSLPIALADMHDCEEFTVKKRRNTENNCPVISEKPDKKRLLTIGKESMGRPTEFKHQPGSPFCFFMEEFSQSFQGHSLIEVSQRGFEAWKDMSFEERTHYFDIASKVNCPFEVSSKKKNCPFEEKIRQEEIDATGKCIDDEASSSGTKICKFQHFEDTSESGSYSSYY